MWISTQGPEHAEGNGDGGSESSGGQRCRVREKRAGDRGEGSGRGAHRGDAKPQAGGDLSMQEGFSVKDEGSGQTAGEEVEAEPRGSLARTELSRGLGADARWQGRSQCTRAVNADNSFRKPGCEKERRDMAAAG